MRFLRRLHLFLQWAFLGLAATAYFAIQALAIWIFTLQPIIANIQAIRAIWST